MRLLPLASLSCVLVLAACGGHEQGAAPAAAEDGGLPKPEAAAQSVTGMPDPGTPSPPPAADMGGAQDVVDLPAPPPDPLPGDDPGVEVDAATDMQQAVSLLRDYYAAINARDYARAYLQWGDGGRASGQTQAQFAAGFATTSGVSVDIDMPDRIEGAAGSRLVEIAVALEAHQSDGGTRRYAGRYTLRRSVVDGAIPAQQAWHIATADLREVQP